MSTLIDRLSLLYWIIEGRMYQVRKRIPGLEYERKKYGKNRILDQDQGKMLLQNGILCERPFLAGRFGASECNILVRYLINEKLLLRKNGYGKHKKIMMNNAGFFPDSDELLDRYCEMVIELYQYIDLLCRMNSLGEGYVVQKYCKNAEITQLTVVDPIKTKWTAVLEGLKVLVIHPFADTIEYQYKHNREYLFPNDNILPKFDLRTVKAVQTIAGLSDDRFMTWFEALEYMFEESLKDDFDVALIGCGAYGLPLGALLKKYGRTAVHMGGCLQLLFGIRGGRWDTKSDMRNVYNQYWVRPSIV